MYGHLNPNAIYTCYWFYQLLEYFIVGFDHGLPCRVKNMAGVIQ